MPDRFTSAYNKRATTLRVRWLALVFVLVGLVGARWYLYFDLAPLLFLAGALALELLAVQFLLIRLRGLSAYPTAPVILELTGQGQVLVELSLLTVAVYLTGGITSPLIPLYLIYIFADGLVSSTRALAAHAVLSVLALAAITVGTFYGWLARLNIGLAPETDLWHTTGFVDSALLLFASFMAITLLIADTLSRRTARREEEFGRSAGALSLRVAQVSTLREVGQRLASSLELEQVLTSVAESALRLVQANDVHIFPYDQDARRFSAGVGVWADGHRGTVVGRPREDGLSARVARTRRPVIVNDAEHDPLFQSPEARAWKFKSIAGFPVIKSNRVLAVMNVAFLQPHRFAHDQEQALHLLTDQAAIAIENARLYQQVQQKIQELSALNAVTRSAAQLTDIKTLLNDALGAVLSAVPADAVLVATLEPTRGVLQLAAQRGLTASMIDEFKAEPVHAAETLSRVLAGGKPLAVGEPTRDVARPAAAASPFASSYAIPLRAYDRAIGVLQFLWKEPHPVTPTEVSLADAIAPQLAVAMHNSALFDETRRRAEELATLRAVGLATTSTLNLREQLRLLYENVNQLLRADTFFVGLYDEARDTLRVEFGVEEGWPVRPVEIPLEQAGLAVRVIRSFKPVMLADLVSDELSTTSGATLSGRADRPARSWLGVPLMLKEHIVGLIAAESFQPGAFAAEDERFLVGVAQHVALALDNARLFAESERRTRELTLLNETSRAINDSLDLDVVMDRAARTLSDQLGCRYVTIYEVYDGQLIRRASVADRSATGSAARPAERNSPTPLESARGIAARVARTGHAAFVLQVATDPDYWPEQAVPGTAANDDVVSEIAVPILREGRVLGVVDVKASRSGDLDEDDLALITVLSDQLAIAASNSSLYREVLGREQFASRLGQLGMTVTATLDLIPLLDILCRESLMLFAVDTVAIFLREETPPLTRDPVTESPASSPLRFDHGSRETPDRSSEYRSSDTRQRLVCRAAAGAGHSMLRGDEIETDQLGDVLARTLRLGRGSIVQDARHTAQLTANVREALQAETCLAVPIIKERDVIGVLLLANRSDPHALGEPELARAGIVAAQAGLAISNARLYQEAQRRAREQSSLYEIGLAISSTLDLNEQLRIIYEQVARHFQLQGFDIALRAEGDQLEFALFVDQGRTLEPFRRPLASAGLAGWVVTSGRPLVIDDIRRQWETLPVKPGEHGTPIETASYIGIPLMIKAEAIGVMALQRAPVQPFTPDEQGFLFALAQQVAFAVDNARLHQHSERTGARQLLLYRASRRIAAAFNINDLIRAIVEALGQDFGYRAALVAPPNSPPLAADPSSSAPAPSGGADLLAGHDLIARAAQTGRTQLSDDSPHLEAAVPVKSGTRVIALLHVAGLDNPIATADVPMFEAIADQLAIAIENANLFASSRERLARINALQNIEVAILSTMNLADRLDLILYHTLAQMRGDVSAILMRDPQTGELYGLRQRGSRNVEAWRELRLRPGEGAAGWIIEHGEPLYIPDVSRDPRWVPARAGEGLVSYLGVPLQVEGRAMGVIDVSTREPRHYTDEEIDFFVTLASHAAVAIENVRLYEQTRVQLELLRNTQDRLVESERRAAIGELVAGLAHEINNPLTAILGHSQLLLENVAEAQLADAWRTEIETINVAAGRIARIVQEFVKLSDAERSSQYRQNAEMIDFAQLIREAVRRFEARDDAQDVAVTTRLPSEPLICPANAQLIGQVMTNILTNALEAMPRGGHIDVEAGLTDPGMVFCTVRDTGDGIPSADIKRVFEPGYTTKVESGIVRGIGLGLYTAERIVKSHGGTIHVESEEGQFTTVTFTLPRHMEESSDGR